MDKSLIKQIRALNKRLKTSKVIFGVNEVQSWLVNAGLPTVKKSGLTVSVKKAEVMSPTELIGALNTVKAKTEGQSKMRTKVEARIKRTYAHEMREEYKDKKYSGKGSKAKNEALKSQLTEEMNQKIKSHDTQKEIMAMKRYKQQFQHIHDEFYGFMIDVDKGRIKDADIIKRQPEYQELVRDFYNINNSSLWSVAVDWMDRAQAFVAKYK